MPAITIRDIPPETHNVLSARAARSGRSLQEYLRAELIALAERPDLDMLLERIRWQKERTGTLMVAEEIVEYRDADRR